MGEPWARGEYRMPPIQPVACAAPVESTFGTPPATVPAPTTSGLWYEAGLVIGQGQSQRIVARCRECSKDKPCCRSQPAPVGTPESSWTGSPRAGL